jgi:hypothetical protein
LRIGRRFHDLHQRADDLRARGVRGLRGDLEGADDAAQGTNAIHGIVLLGGLLVVGQSGADTLVKVAGTIAVTFGTINIVGGFLVTDRMLEMFKGRGERKPQKTE